MDTDNHILLQILGKMMSTLLAVHGGYCGFVTDIAILRFMPSVNNFHRVFYQKEMLGCIAVTLHILSRCHSVRCLML